MRYSKKSQSGQVMIRGAVLIGSVVSVVGLQSSVALSEPLQNAFYRVLKGVIGVFVTVVGSFTGLTTLPVALQEGHKPAIVAVRHVLQSPKEKPMITLISESPSGNMNKYAYVFSGKVTHDGQACAMASLDFHGARST